MFFLCKNRPPILKKEDGGKSLSILTRAVFFGHSKNMKQKNAGFFGKKQEFDDLSRQSSGKAGGFLFIMFGKNGVLEKSKKMLSITDKYSRQDSEAFKSFTQFILEIAGTFC